MSGTVETILLYTIGAGLLSIVYGFLTGKNILNSSAGNAKMQEIASIVMNVNVWYVQIVVVKNSICLIN